MGHSLGEYSALVAAGAMGYAEALRIVAERGAAMRAAGRAAPGAMAALLGVADDDARALAEAAGEVWPANFNCPGQVVVSGTAAGVERLLAAGRRARLARDPPAGGRRLPLAADGPGRRAPAARAGRLGAGGARPALPLDHHLRPRAARAACARCCSTSSPRRCASATRWPSRSTSGADRFVEVGPGRVLSGLVKRVRRDAAGGPGGRAGRRGGPRPPDAGRARHRREPRDRRRLRARRWPRTASTWAWATPPTPTAPRRRSPRSRPRAGAPTVHAADVADEAQAAGLVEAVEEALGPLDALVLNAGITRDGLAVRMGADDWAAVIDTNLTGAFFTARPALRGMLRRRAGSIVAVSSIVGLTGNAGQANYAAAKAGLIGLVRALAREAGPPRRARQRRRARLHRDRHDGRPLRRAARVDPRRDPARPPRRARGRGGRGGVPLLGRTRPSSRAPCSPSTAGWGPREPLRDGNGRRRVVVTGVGLVTSLGIGREENWAAAVAGRSGAAPIARLRAAGHGDHHRLRGQAASTPPTSWSGAAARRMDRFAQLAVARRPPGRRGRRR